MNTHLIKAQRQEVVIIKSREQTHANIHKGAKINYSQSLPISGTRSAMSPTAMADVTAWRLGGRVSVLLPRLRPCKGLFILDPELVCGGESG